MEIAPLRRIFLAALLTASILGAQVVFVPDSQDSRLYSFSIGANGALIPLGAFSGSGGEPWAVAVDPTGRFLYTANLASNDVTAYSIGAGGVPNSDRRAVLGVDPIGLFVYVTNCGSSNVSAYAIGPNGGLTPIGAPGAAGMCPSAVAVDPTGRFVYAANASGQGEVSAYSIGPNGALAPISGPVVSIGGGSTALAVDPTGRFLYATSTLSNAVFTYRIGEGGALSAAGAATINGGPYPVTVDPSGRNVYVASYTVREAEQVFAFRIGTPVGSPICNWTAAHGNCRGAGRPIRLYCERGRFFAL